jgi:hypothetical protein
MDRHARRLPAYELASERSLDIRPVLAVREVHAHEHRSVDRGAGAPANQIEIHQALGGLLTRGPADDLAGGRINGQLGRAE